MGHDKTKRGGQKSFIEKKSKVLKSNPSQGNPQPGERESWGCNLIAVIMTTRTKL